MLYCHSRKDIIHRTITIQHTYIHTYTPQNVLTHTKVNSYINSQIYTYNTIRVAWFEVCYNNPIDHGRCRGLNFLWRLIPLLRNPDNGLQLEWRDLMEKSLIRTIHNLLRDGSTDVYRFLRMPYILFLHVSDCNTKFPLSDFKITFCVLHDRRLERNRRTIFWL